MRPCRPIYGDREPLHVGTVVPYRLGGPDPIHGISAYKNVEPHALRHFVTYGFVNFGRSNRPIPTKAVSVSN